MGSGKIPILLSVTLDVGGERVRKRFSARKNRLLGWGESGIIEKRGGKKNSHCEMPDMVSHHPDQQGHDLSDPVCEAVQRAKCEEQHRLPLGSLGARPGSPNDTVCPRAVCRSSATAVLSPPSPSALNGPWWGAGRRLRMQRDCLENHQPKTRG